MSTVKSTSTQVVQVTELNTQVVQVAEPTTRVVAEQTNVRIISSGVQGPAGGSGPLRVATLEWAPSMTVDWSEVDLVRITLTGATTLTFTGAQDNQRLILELEQDAEGGRTVVFPNTLRFSNTLPAIVLSTVGGKLDRIGFIYRAGSTAYDVIAIAIGY